MHEASLGMPRLRPGIGKQEEQPIEAGVRKNAQQGACVIGPQAQVRGEGRIRFAPLRRQPGEQRADAIVEHLAGDQARFGRGGDLRQRVLAAAVADLEPQRPGARRKGGARVGRGLVRGDQQSRQRHIQQQALTRPERMAPRASVKSVRRRLERSQPAQLRTKAERSDGTRSVFSQVKVPFASSGSRPKWP